VVGVSPAAAVSLLFSIITASASYVVGFYRSSHCNAKRSRLQCENGRAVTK
jgi:hypothetical protein